MLGIHKTISLPQSTPYAQEMAKWEAFPSQWSPTPGRPYQFREFPKRMYKAAYTPGKGTEIVDAHTVNDAAEEMNLRSRGFSFGHAEAFEAVRKEQAEHGRLAAETNFEISHGRISEKAAAEVEAAREAHGARHLPMVPETPIKRRGRKPKAVADA